MRNDRKDAKNSKSRSNAARDFVRGQTKHGDVVSQVGDFSVRKWVQFKERSRKVGKSRATEHNLY